MAAAARASPLSSLLALLAISQPSPSPSSPSSQPPPTSARRYAALNALTARHPDAPRHLDPQLCARFLELPQAGVCLRAFLSGWFLGAEVESICRGNVEELVAYGELQRGSGSG